MAVSQHLWNSRLVFLHKVLNFSALLVGTYQQTGQTLEHSDEVQEYTADH